MYSKVILTERTWRNHCVYIDQSEYSGLSSDWLIPPGSRFCLEFLNNLSYGSYLVLRLLFILSAVEVYSLL